MITGGKLFKEVIKMSDIKLTRDKMKTYSGEQSGFLKTGASLEEFGKKQNSANEALAANINELLKRVTAVETEQIRQIESMNLRISELERRELEHREILKKIATELNAAKRTLDRVRLSDKLNTSAVERISKALNLTEENENISEE